MWCASNSAEPTMARTSSHVVDNTRSPLNVEEEYTRALRTKSFLDMWKKAHHQLKRTMSTTGAAAVEAATEEAELSVFRTQTSPLSLTYYERLPEFLLEPGQEALLKNCDDGGSRRLLIEFFDTTLEACNACMSLLASIDHARSHRRSLRRLLLRACSGGGGRSVFSDLVSHVQLDNPLSAKSLAGFHRAHALYAPLIRRLSAAHRRIVRRARVIRLAKRAAVYGGAAVCGAAALAAAAHSVVGLAFVPAVVLAAPARWVRRRAGGGGGGGRRERAGAQVDAAAKGTYIVGRDLDTVSRMVRRLHDEVEHDRDVGWLVLQSREPEMAREVAREMEGGEAGFGEQMAELEEHVYLCLLTINRSRRLVAEEMSGGTSVVAAPPTEA